MLSFHHWQCLQRFIISPLSMGNIELEKSKHYISTVQKVNFNGECIIIFILFEYYYTTYTSHFYKILNGFLTMLNNDFSHCIFFFNEKQV